MLYIRYAKGAIYIQAWASALLVLTVTGNTRDSKCGTSNKISSHVLPQNYILLLLIINMLQVGV